MPTAVKETTTQLVPIAKVVVDKGFNNRRSLGDLSELAASIKSVGLLEPLLVWRENGSLHLIAGERRLAASKLAGKKDIEIKLVDFDEKLRLEALLVENLHRKDIDPLEEADGYRRLLDFGLKQGEIAKKVGRSEAHISKRLALTNLSPLTAKLLAAGTIPIESAIGLAKYKHDYQDRAIEHVKKMYSKLEDAAPYQLRNLGNRARDEQKKVERSNQRRELTKKLKADGVTIISGQGSYSWGQPGHPWRLGKSTKDSYRAESRVDLTPKQHAEFACHAASVTAAGSIYDHAEPKVVYLCSDPTSHMDADEKAKYKKKITDGKRDTYEERQHRADEVREQVAQAREARLPAIREQLKAFDRPTLLKLALEALVMGANQAALAGVLGLEVSKGKDAWGIVASYCNASEANLVRAAAASAIDDGEDVLADLTHAHAGGYYFNRDGLPQAAAVAAWFKQSQIDLGELQVKALEKATKK